MGLTASTSRLLRAEPCDWPKRSSAISSRMRSPHTEQWGDRQSCELWVAGEEAREVLLNVSGNSRFELRIHLREAARARGGRCHCHSTLRSLCQNVIAWRLPMRSAIRRRTQCARRSSLNSDVFAPFLSAELADPRELPGPAAAPGRPWAGDLLPPLSQLGGPTCPPRSPSPSGPPLRSPERKPRGLPGTSGRTSASSAPVSRAFPSRCASWSTDGR